MSLESLWYIKNFLGFSSVPSKEDIKEIVKEHKDDKPEQKKPLDFKVIKTTKEVAPKLEKYIKKVDATPTSKDDIIVGGSAAAYTQVSDSRVPTDLDVEAADQEKAKKDIVKILKTKYNNVTTRSMIREDGRKYIQVLVDGKPVVDIKPMDKPGHKIEINHKFVHLEHAPVKIGGIFYERSSDLMAKKAKAINENYYTPISKDAPIKSRVSKDVSDFWKISESFVSTHRQILNYHPYIPIQKTIPKNTLPNLKTNFHLSNFPKIPMLEPKKSKRKRKNIWGF